jgi:tripartite-type tricarboxylate transporter receptor subunit TctC
MKTIRFLFLALMLASPFALGQSKDFPNRSIKIIVPYAPGSGADTTARFFGQQLAAVFGQSVVVENRPGGSGAVAVTAVRNAPADGYTMLLAGNSPVTVNPIVMKNLSYDPVRDLRPVSGLIRSQSVIIVGANSPHKTLSNLVTAARKSKQPLTAGTSAAGYHLAGAWFGSFADFRFTNVPYNSVPQSITDVISNEIDFAVSDLTGSAPLLKSGRIRALAVSGEKRHPDFPDVPTIAESGYPQCVSYNWNSFFIHADTPEAVTAVLAGAMQKIHATSAAEEFAKRVGVELMPLGPAALRKFQVEEIDRFKRIAKSAGIEPQ